jgi:hypothetical protein
MSSDANDTEEFETAMREMAADPQIQAECEPIWRDFSALESGRVSVE